MILSLTWSLGVVSSACLPVCHLHNSLFDSLLKAEYIYAGMIACVCVDMSYYTTKDTNKGISSLRSHFKEITKSSVAFLKMHLLIKLG